MAKIMPPPKHPPPTASLSPRSISRVTLTSGSSLSRSPQPTKNPGLPESPDPPAPPEPPVPPDPPPLLKIFSVPFSDLTRKSSLFAHFEAGISVHLCTHSPLQFNHPTNSNFGIVGFEFLSSCVLESSLVKTHTIRRFVSREVFFRTSIIAQQWLDAQFVLLMELAHLTLLAPTRQQPLATVDLAFSMCFIDAAWLASSFEYGLGWRLLDARKPIVVQGLALHQFTSSALVAETLAVKTAIIAVPQAGFRKFHVNSVSLSLVTSLNTGGVVNEMKNLLTDIYYLVAVFHFISFFNVSCSAISLAELLAKNVIVSLNSSIDGG